MIRHLKQAQGVLRGGVVGAGLQARNDRLQAPGGAHLPLHACKGSQGRPQGLSSFVCRVSIRFRGLVAGCML